MFIEYNNYSFPVAYDVESKITERFKIKHLPTLFIIDKAGRLRIKHIGCFKKYENLEALLVERFRNNFAM